MAEFGKKGVSLFGLEQDKFHHLRTYKRTLLPRFNSFPQQAHLVNRMCQLVLDDEVAHGVDRVYINQDVFAPSFDLTGGEGSATITYQGRHFCFVAKHKNPDGSCCRRSPLYEWRRGKYQLVQELDHDDGAHGACLFEATNSKLLAIACCGDREKKSYARNSPVYEISLDEDGGAPEEVPPDDGRRRVCSFRSGGRTYLAVANEQDERRGGNVESVVWAVTGRWQMVASIAGPLPDARAISWRGGAHLRIEQCGAARRVPMLGHEGQRGHGAVRGHRRAAAATAAATAWPVSRLPRRAGPPSRYGRRRPQKSPAA